MMMPSTNPKDLRHQRHPITQKQSSPSKPCGHRHHLRRRVVDLHCELALSSSLAPLSPSLPLKPSLNPVIVASHSLNNNSNVV
ncbi:hypothetical protein GBA52_020015 [Prunus armeniaca]|nr:hypothetical protein GBA52_020015 [Prunus armeniaca]